MEGKTAAPAEAHHEVGDAERDHDQDREEAAARQVGALHEPGGQRPDGDAEDHDHDDERHGVPHQHGGQVPEEQLVQLGPAHLDRLDHQEDEREEHDDRDEDGGGRQEGREAALPAARTRVSARSAHSSCASCRSLIASAPVPSSAIVIPFGWSGVERGLVLRRRDAGCDGVLEAVAVGDDLLALDGGEEGQEALGRLLMARGLEDARAGDVHDVADVVRGEVGDGRVQAARADLGPLPVPVVLVDDAEGDLAAVDGAGERLVAGVVVTPGVRLDRLEPAQRRRLAVGPRDARDDRLEVRLAPGDADAARPTWGPPAP